MSIRLDTIPALDRQKQTDGPNDGQICHNNIGGYNYDATAIRLRYHHSTYGPPAVRSVTLNLSNFSEVTK